MKKQRPVGALFMWCVIVGVVCILLISLGQKVVAFGGHCIDRAGNLVEECVNNNKSRYVPITYATGTFRRSRSGSSYRNYINREATEAKRRATKERNRFKRTYTRVGVAKSSDITAILYQKALQRRKEAKAFMSKYE